jgi:ATP-binding cassette subfamily F protein uup
LVLYSAVGITKNYSEKPLLNDVSLHISEGDRIGVVGINGTGKSTFLKIIAGLETPDAGTVTKAGGLKIGYLPQNPVFKESMTVLEQVFEGVSAAFKQMQEHEAKTILTKLGITDFDREIGLLSGGEKKRVSIASALINPSDLLILDEPTNHIDNDMVGWLEKYLQKYTGALLMVTHDRYFLDRITNKIVEIDRGAMYSYDANYSTFLALKAQREEMAAGSERKRRSFLRRELEWIQRGVRGRGTKSKARVERYETVKDSEREAAGKKLDLSSVTTRLGGKTVHLNSISKSFGQRPLIRNFEYILLRDDRVGIIGSNGCGKSTLLRLICGELTPDSGTVETGETVKIGYFSQECGQMDTSVRVLDYIRGIAENIVTVDGVLTAAQMLDKFLFPPDQLWTPIDRLSGGERRRLYLLSTIMQAPNILLLDEPTNDLDIMTLMILEDYLAGFNGAVVVVSHDRYFLDKVVDKVFAFEEDGTLKQYLGGYSSYLVQSENDGEQESKPPPKAKAAPRAAANEGAPQKARFTYNEQQEYAAIDGVIAHLEQQLEAVKAEKEAQASNYLRLEELLKKEGELEEQLHEKMERWLYLNDIAAQIAAQKQQ